MDPDILARIQAVLAALNDRRQQIQSGAMNLAQNVAAGLDEGVNANFPSGMQRPMPGPSPLARFGAGADDHPMPLTQTLAMLGGMVLFPGPDGPKARGSFDSPEALRETLRSLDDKSLIDVATSIEDNAHEAMFKRSTESRLNSAEMGIAEPPTRHVYDSGPLSGDFISSNEHAMRRVTSWEVENELLERFVQGEDFGYTPEMWDYMQKNFGDLTQGDARNMQADLSQALNRHYELLNDFRSGGRGFGFVGDAPQGARRGSPRPDGPMQPTQMESLTGARNIPDMEIPNWGVNDDELSRLIRYGDARLPTPEPWLAAIIEEMLLDAPKGPSNFDRFLSRSGDALDPMARYGADNARGAENFTNDNIATAIVQQMMRQYRSSTDDSRSER